MTPREAAAEYLAAVDAVVKANEDYLTACINSRAAGRKQLKAVRAVCRAHNRVVYIAHLELLLARIEAVWAAIRLALIT